MAESRRLKALAGAVRDRSEGGFPEAPIVIALSGGADSAIAAWLSVDLDKRTRAVHVDHGFPGSPMMRRSAAAIAETLGIDLAVVEVTVAPGSSPEGQARDVRYAALADVLASSEWLVTGHTLDDQAETVLANLVRGAGLEGISGIPRDRIGVARPLLGVRRSETRELATLLGLPWKDDPANTDLSARRNVIRREVLPELSARFNPQLVEALASLADRANEAVARQASEIEKVPIRQIDGEIAVPIAVIRSAGSVTAAAIVRKALRMVRGPHAGTKREVDAVLAAIVGDTAKIELAGNVTVACEGPLLVFTAGAGHSPLDEVIWAIPGAIDAGRWTLESWVEHSPPVAFPLSAWSVVMEADAVSESVAVRPVDATDRIDGLRVIDVLRSAGVPRGRRESWPAVVSNGAIIWIPGARLSRSVWVTRETQRYLWMDAHLEGE